MRVGLIDRQVVDIDKLPDPADPSDPIVLQNDVIVQVSAGDVLQVRVLTRRAAAAAVYQVELTGNPATNWVSFERVDD